MTNGLAKWSCVLLARNTGRRKKFRRSHAPYLAEIRLFWCDSCNVPTPAKTECSTCGSIPRRVGISPPGDPYPAMEGHLNYAIKTIDTQFGEGVGKDLLPAGKTIVMNKIPSLDAMFEIVIDGYIIGRLRYEVPKHDYTFLLTLEGGRRIGQSSRQKWVSCYDDVLQYLKKGANLMVPGIAGCDSDIEVGDEVWVTDSNGSVIGVGTARMSGEQIAAEPKGYAIKIREVDNPRPPAINPKNATWDEAVNANAREIDRIEEEAVTFIRRTIEKRSLPVVVGFSGGKDSLATYLLVEKALGRSPPLFFMDTGLELPETVQYVSEFAERHETIVVGQKAGHKFWESIGSFGPPARDFRWCCKILKLGPAALSISEELDGSTLTFMGQRKLESFQRSVERRVSHNPWVPGQTSANPIQNWNALEVWLYIFREKEPFNIMYNKGYHRMGCYLCPSSPLAEIESLGETHPELHTRWREELNRWAQKLGLPEEWVDMGFWRWKRLPPGQLGMIDSLGLEIEADSPGRKEGLDLTAVKGVSPCVESGFSFEGQFSAGIDLDRVSKLAPIFGKTKVSQELGALRTKSGENTISLFSSGSLVIRGNSNLEVDQLARQAERAVKRSLFCQACGTCVPQCEQDALNLNEGMIAVDEAKCTNCLKCDQWPCPIYLD
ncbi:MAG: phosphoadenosine phosphosulfate reductase family protein [Candidatus Thorarchaeota archaeon]